MDVRMYIEPATTGGTSPDVQHFAFLHVTTPVTFCLIRNIMYSCSSCTGMRDKNGLSELKGIWIDVANHQSTFGGMEARGANLFSGHTISFSDIFDPDGYKFLPQHTTPAACIVKARNYMKMQTAKKMSSMTGLSRMEILRRVQVTFPNIDSVVGSAMLVEFYDTVWKEFSHKSTMAWSARIEEYEKACAQWQDSKEKGRKDEVSLDFSAGAAGDSEEEPVLECPYMCRLPTYINWDNQDLANELVDLSATPEENRISQLYELQNKYESDINFDSFPETEWKVHINMTMVLPHLEAVSLAETLHENKNFAIPQNIILEMQMQTSQPNPIRKDLREKMTPVSQQWMNSIHTGHELRKYVANSAKHIQSQNPLFDFRAQEIFELHVQKRCSMIEDVNERVQHFHSYFRTTGVPYCKTIATVDTGELGGANKRVASAFVIGDLTGTNGYRSHRKQTCDKWAEKARKMHAGSGVQFETNGGSLYRAHKHLNAIWSMYNVLVPTKPDNTYIILSILLGDIASSLSGWLGCLGMCSNKIGHVIWVCDFAGNLYQYENAKGGKTDLDVLFRILEKSMGVGIDWALTQYFKNNNPNNFTQPQLKKVPHPDVNDVRGLSEHALSYQLCSVVDQKGKVLSQPTELPPPCYATELGEYKEGAAGGVNIIDKLNNATIRNTETMGGMVRQVVGSRDDSKKGFQECFTQSQCFGLRALVVSANKVGPNYAAKQFAEVVYRVPSGADLSSNNEAEDAATARATSRMGATSKYTNGKRDPELAGCERVIFLDFASVALAVCDMQQHGLMSRIESGFDLEVFKVAANVILQLEDYLARDTNIARWNRMLAIVQTRSTAFGVLLHSVRAITAPGREAWSFEDFVADAAFTWRCNPWPVECIPAAIRMLVEQAFDWGYWLVLGVFCDYFKVPCIDVKTIHDLFDDPDQSYCVDSSSQREAVQKWLAGFGLCSLHRRQGGKAGSVIFAPERDSSLMLQSGVYLTSYMQGDSVEGSDLAFLVKDEATNSANAAETSSSALCRTVAKIVSKFIIDKYGTRLAAWCNAKRRESLEIILTRYLNKPMGALCIGNPDGGRGYESVDNILRAFGCPDGVADCGLENSEIYMDGGHPRIRAQLEKAKQNYKIPHLVYFRRGGNCCQFGVEIRSLLMARSLMQESFTQTHIRTAFLELTGQYMEGRMPQSIYPHSQIHTNTPGMDSSAFAFKSIAVGSGSNRPETLCRSLPIIPVQHGNSNMLQGCCYGGIAAEEGCIIDGSLRLAFEICSEPGGDKRHMRVFDFHFPNCPAPGLPVDMNVPVRLSTDVNSPTEFCWGQVVFQNDQYELYVSDVGKFTNTQVLAHAADSEVAVRGLCDVKTDNHHTFKTAEDMVQNDLGLVFDWTFLFSRPGILIKFEVLPGISMYATLQTWDDGQWLHRDTFAYKLLSGVAHDDDPNSPANKALTQLMNEYRVGQGSAVLEDVFLALEKCPEQEAEMRMRILHNRGLGVSCATNDFVANSMMPVGSMVNIEVSHSLLWDEFRDSLYFDNGDNKRITPVTRKPAVAKVFVVEAMLLYELPKDVYRNCALDGDIVWVGVKTVNMLKKAVSARFYGVPTQAICDSSLLRLLRVEPVQCVCVRRGIDE